jgi:hypothetical protein
MKDTVKKLKAEADIEKARAVEEAIQKEQDTAQILLNDQSRIHEQKIIELNEVKLNELNQKLEELKEKLTSEYEKLIVVHVEKVIEEKNAEIAGIIERFEKMLLQEAERYQLKLDDIEVLNSKIIELNEEICQLKDIIEGVRDEYQNCIAHFSHLKKKEADFLFPVLEKRKLTY